MVTRRILEVIQVKLVRGGDMSIHDVHRLKIEIDRPPRKSQVTPNSP